MPSHTVRDARGEPLVTWSDGSLTGDPDLISMLTRLGARRIGTGPLQTDLESELGFRECCRFVFGPNVDIRPPIENPEGIDL